VKLPQGFQGMAEYSVGSQWRVFIQYLPALLCTAYLPIVASVPVAKRKKLMFLNMGMVAGTAAVGAIGVFALSPWILKTYGHGYGEAKWVVGFMLIAGVADATNSILMQTLMASNRAWLRLISNGVWGILAVSSSLVLIPRFGAMGLAMAVCLAQSAHLLIQFPLTLYCVNKIEPTSK
jgi:O-antigen/teichoic acid export membrane protein